MREGSILPESKNPKKVSSGREGKEEKEARIREFG